MFKTITIPERLKRAEMENTYLKAQLTQTVAQTAYIAMMSDVELPAAEESQSNAEGAEDDEQMV